MRFILLFAFLSLSVGLFAQNWAAGLWIYTMEDPDNETVYFSEYQGGSLPTVVEGQHAYEMIWSLAVAFESSFLRDTFYVYESNDSIFVHGLQENDPDFHLWMVFGGEVGDTLTLDNPRMNEFGPPTYRLRLDSIHPLAVTQFVGVIPPQHYYYTPLDTFSFIPGNQLVAGVGSPIALVPWAATASFMNPYIFCRGEGSMGNGINFEVSNESGGVCYQVVIPNQATDRLPDSYLSIYPNPTLGTLYYRSEESLAGLVYHIWSSTGVRVQSGTLPPDQQLLLPDHLPPGVYWLEVQADDRRGYWRFIKM